MRKTINDQLQIGEVNIEEIIFDNRSRDEIPKILIGLQAIYCDFDLRTKIFSLLEENIKPNDDKNIGRPGMDLWKILVLGCIRLNSNLDYDKLRELANQHMTLRQMLGHSLMDVSYQYALQTLKDNISLFSPELIDKINQEVVTYGLEKIFKKKAEIVAHCDSFPVKRNIHFPTDISLLWDSIKGLITKTYLFSKTHEIKGSREYKSILKKIKNKYRKLQKIRYSNSKDSQKRATRISYIINQYSEYMNQCLRYITSTEKLIAPFQDEETSDNEIKRIEELIDYATTFIDQIKRRIIENEKIPHSEKVFSIFEPDTEWICKGKSGLSQELGLNVCIVTSETGLILNHKVMYNTTDSKIAVEIIKETKEKFSDLESCSFDKGFHSPDNQIELEKYLSSVILPKKGKLSAERKKIEYSKNFRKIIKHHPAVESSIFSLKNHGLGICKDKGKAGFERYVGLAILARNIQIIGNLLQMQLLKKTRSRKLLRICKLEKSA